MITLPRRLATSVPGVNFAREVFNFAGDCLVTLIAMKRELERLAAFDTYLQTQFESIESDTEIASTLRSATTLIDIAAAAAPTAGDVLTATSSTAATWQAPSGGSLGVWNPDVPDTTVTGYDATTSDEFDAGSLDAKWLEADPAGKLTLGIDTPRRMMSMDLISAGVAAWTFAYQAVPGSEFAAYAKVYCIQPVTSQVQAGVFVSEDLAAAPTTADIRAVSTYYYNSIVGLESGTYSAYNGGISASYSLETAGYHQYVRIRCNGTTCSTDVSIDGVSWVTTATAVLGFTPVHFGIGARSTTTAGKILVDFFRVYEGAGTSAVDATYIGKRV